MAYDAYTKAYHVRNCDAYANPYILPNPRRVLSGNAGLFPKALKSGSIYCSTFRPSLWWHHSSLRGILKYLNSTEELLDSAKISGGITAH